jgi:hypothetical protein
LSVGKLGHRVVLVLRRRDHPGASTTPSRASRRRAVHVRRAVVSRLPRRGSRSG